MRCCRSSRCSASTSASRSVVPCSPRRSSAFRVSGKLAIDERRELRPADAAGRRRRRDARDHHLQPHRRSDVRRHRSEDQALVSIAARQLRRPRRRARTRRSSMSNDLRTYFKTEDGIVRAVDGVSFERAGRSDARRRRRVRLRQERHDDVDHAPQREVGAARPRTGRRPGLADGVVSASTRRSTSRSRPARPSSGARTCFALRTRGCVSIRGSEIAMIFQDPMTSLNPVRWSATS